MTDVVVTGVGAVSPLGIGAAKLHERWVAGVCGIADGEGRCRDFDPTEHLSVKDARRADRFTQLALVATLEALADAGWEDELPYRPRRSARSSAPASAASARSRPTTAAARARAQARLAARRSADDGQRRGRSGQHAPRSEGPELRRRVGLRGGHARDRRGDAGDPGRRRQAIVAGGAEAALTPLSRAAFAALDALSASRHLAPFDARRDGFVMGEGAGVLVLENGEAARARGARILAVVRGYGATADAYHITAPPTRPARAPRARSRGRSPTPG